jgi:hypothetical protein
MKKFIFATILAGFFAAGSAIVAQEKQDDYLGLPGDNLNLYAVMKLFQVSKTLEEFERDLNDEQSNINNLDLNGDGLIDYIRVFDNVDGDVHNIVLQVAVSRTENQDVAVFTVQRFNNGQVQIQLTGDEELYGRNYIIEPIFDDDNTSQTLNPGYTGNSRNVPEQNITYVRTTPAEIAGWPLVRFIFLPTYTVWHSSWYWGYYPSYWHPWRPFYWHYYYGYHYNWYNDYYGHYRRWDYHRYSRWNDYYYTSRRSYSPAVYHRIEAGNYKKTYSHPDQRRRGEAKFAEMHPDQYKRVSDNRAISTRRSGTTVTQKSDKNLSSGRNSGTFRRSNTSVTNRSVSNPPSDRNTMKNRRSVNTGTSRSVSNSSRGQNAIDNKTIRQSKTTGVSSSKSIKRNKIERTNKKVEKTKDPENKDTNRRK